MKFIRTVEGDLINLELVGRIFLRENYNSREVVAEFATGHLVVLAHFNEYNGYASVAERHMAAQDYLDELTEKLED